MASTIDVRSADILLVHDGSEVGAAGAPARDLSPNDIGRLAYRRALADVTDLVGRPIDPEDPEAGVITRPDPRNPDRELVATIIEELQASGRYAPAPAQETLAPKTARARRAENSGTTDQPEHETETTNAGAGTDSPPNDEPAGAAETPEA